MNEDEMMNLNEKNRMLIHGDIFVANNLWNCDQGISESK